MELTALLLSRIQFAFTISFHVIFPSFTIGLAAWLTVLESLGLATGRLVYRTPDVARRRERNSALNYPEPLIPETWPEPVRTCTGACGNPRRPSRRGA